jgi:hypothetical protein
MKKYLLLFLIIVTACSEPGSYNYVSSKINFSEFQNPSKDYRAVPFYSLNDLLDSAEIDRQIAEFARGGYGGVYLHSRTGLLTEYLGEDWWKAMDAGMKACERTNTYAWFYDEDKWPSGFAGGLVPLKSEEYHARCLMRLKKSRELPEGSVLLNEDDDYYYLLYKAKSGNSWFNGTCYVDLLNPETVKEFIESSYTPYAERYRKYFGQSALGIFTDEPQFFPSTDGVAHDGVLPFSQVLIEIFKKDNGYDLIPLISGLYDTIPGYEKLRLDYYRTLSKQFEISFSKQIGDYCHDNNMMFTGHYNGEESLTSVRSNVGNLMLQARNMQQPGLDHLGLRIDGALNSARSISSVANQYGITRRLSEAYGISGQNMNFEDRAWVASWHTLNGINHLCPHLALYSMKGTRKRDYPPTLSFQQPYWPYNKLLEDYAARLCYVSTIGRYAPEFLVIHPLESEYIEGGTDLKSWTGRNSDYIGILEKLQENQRDYDLGDEQIIADKGFIEGNLMAVGEQTYKAVILPHMLTIRQSTIDLLTEFAQKGGKIIAVGMPSFIDGIKDEKKLDDLEKILINVNAANFSETIQKEIIPEVMVTGDGAKYVWISNRLSGKKHILQVTNTSRLDIIRCKINFKEKSGNIALLDPASGKMYTITDDNGYELLLHPAQTFILTDIDLINKPAASGSYTIPETENTLMAISGNWEGKRQDVNSLTLDFARYSTDGGLSFSKQEPVIGIHDRFTSEMYNGPLILAFDFTIDILPSDCNLVLEQPGMFSKIEVNGRPVNYEGNAFYRDMSFKTTEITGYLNPGKNNVFLYLNYKAPVQDSRDPAERYGSEIESIYLTGDFAVEAEKSKRTPEPSQRNARGFLVPKPVSHFASFVLSKEKTIFNGDLTNQGYPFYNGSFLLEKKFDLKSMDKNKTYVLKFPLSEAIVIKVDINGVALPPLAWSPWELDITGAIREGSNSISITLVNSLRNLLGPHHNAEGELIALSPESFTGRSTWTTRREGEDNWYDLRLKGEGSTNIWRDDYCIIPFGLLEDPVIVER